MAAPDPPARARPYEPPRGAARRLSDLDLPADRRDPAPPAAGPARRLGDADLPAGPAVVPRWAQSHTGAPPPPPPAPPVWRVGDEQAASDPSRGVAGDACASRRVPLPAAPTKSRRNARRPVSRATGVRMRRRPIILGILAVFALALCGVIAPRVFKIQELANDIFVTPPPRDGLAAYPDWNKQERVNILLMGLDTRQPGDSRSDTLILVSVDPAAKTAALLSIPRDLWAPIPGYGSNRINAAYQFGETNNVPGGGPALVSRTVEQNFGVPVHYFAQVDFQGFRRIVDALGGVTVDVQRPLIDNEYPADYGFAYQRVYIPAGLQHMDGRTALQYVRSRHADSDLGRNERQQAVLLALREEGTQLSILSKLDTILSQLKGALRTDLSITQVGSLAKLAQNIPHDKVQQLSLAEPMISQGSVDGADVLLPHWDLIRPAVSKLLGQPDSSSENAVISVYNGTDTAGLALSLADELRGAGFNVPADAVGNPPDAGGGRYPRTTVIDFSGGKKPATLSRLLTTLQLTSDRVRPPNGSTAPAGADLQVLIGDDRAK
jgi:polyisoprenyl-teichoic acid--peptidoglycan teichoic acid transferase